MTQTNGQNSSENWNPRVIEPEMNGRATAGLAVSKDKLLEHISSPGALGLSALLDRKRIQWGIPDEAFTTSQATFNKLLVWQIPLSTSETYEGTSILKTDAAQRRDRLEAPRGIIVSAGLQALDTLRSHGIDVGHTVGFVRMAPFRRQFTVIGGVALHLIILHDSEIIDSEELNEALRNRQARVVAQEQEDGTCQHFYVDENGKRWKPMAPQGVEDS